MPVVKAPLLSENVRGKLGKDIYYTNWKGQNRVIGLRLQNIYKFWLTKKRYFSQTEGQQAIRGTFKKAVIEWNKLTAPEKKVYIDKAKNLKNSAIGIFIENWIKNYYNRVEFKKAWLFSVGIGQSLFLFKPEYMESYLVNRNVRG